MLSSAVTESAVKRVVITGTGSTWYSFRHLNRISEANSRVIVEQVQPEVIELGLS